MPIVKGAVGKTPPAEKQKNRDGKTSVVNKNAKETGEKHIKASSSVGVSSKPPSKSSDTSVSKQKQNGGSTEHSKEGSDQKKPTERQEKVSGIRRQEKSSVREPVIKSRAFDTDKSRNAKVTSLPTRPVAKTKIAGGTSHQKSKPAIHPSSSVDTSNNSKINVIAHSGKKMISLPSKASSLPSKALSVPSKASSVPSKKPVLTTHTSDANKQSITHITSVTKRSKASAIKPEKGKLNTTRTSKNVDAEVAVPLTEKSKDVGKLQQDGELEASISRLGRARTRTRTLSPEEVKVLRNIVAKKLEHSKRGDSCITRTPRKSEYPCQSTEVEVDGAEIVEITANSNEDGEEYSDDFEDYESDFEDATDTDLDASMSVGDARSDASSVSDEDRSSDDDLTDVVVVEMTSRQHLPVEEEKKLDSGNYDLAEKRRMGKELQEIKVAMEQENSAATDNRKTCDAYGVEPVLADEGFVEEKPEELKFSATVMLNTNFVNFANARKRQLEKKATAKVKKRGEELLGMVTLDIVGFSLLDIAPIPYEIYMKSYGRSNSLQVHVQTNEDSISEEVQTENVVVKNKWTQKPVSYCTKLQPGELTRYSQCHLGVGGDEADEDLHAWKNRITFNSIRLQQFLSSVGQVVLTLLEEGQMHDGSLLRPSPCNLNFSEGYIALGVESVPFLAGQPVTCVTFSQASTNLLLTVHGCHNQIEGRDSKEDDVGLGRNVICVWNLLEPSLPQKVLVGSQQVCSACFDPAKASLVFGGLVDGSVCVWDLEEQSLHHKTVRAGTSDFTIRSPTYTTAEILKCKGHLGAVVSLQPITEVESRDNGSLRDLSPMQVCSLDEGGLLLLWTVVRSRKPGERSGLCERDLGLAPWGRVRLLRSAALHFLHNLDSEDTLQCCDLALDRQRTDHMYVATMSGQVVHCLRSGAKPRPAAYVSTWGGLSSARCLESCPFGQPFFLVGCMEGIVRLHCQASEKPLLTLAATGDVLGQGPPIIGLQWSRSCPFVIFVLDSLSRLHIWDLSVSDMYPQYSVQLTDITATAIQLSPHIVGGKNPPQLMLASSCGRVEVHQLKEELVCRPHNELDKFLYYTSLL